VDIETRYIDDREKLLEQIAKERRSKHKCYDCPFANWLHDRLVFCTYSPVSCIRGGKNNGKSKI
jgi:hypothetical protein